MILALKVNNGGRIVQTFQWNSIPLSFKFAGDFLFISHFYNLEIIKIGVNQEPVRYLLPGDLSGGPGIPRQSFLSKWLLFDR